MMQNQLQFIEGARTESLAHIYLSARADTQIDSMVGKITGPACRFSRTLPAQFTVSSANRPGSDRIVSAAVIIDPCYWTPALPFLYELQVQLQLHDGRQVQHTAEVGLRRWDHAGRNFRLQTRRFVLRGTLCEQLGREAVEQARAAETALIVARYDQQFCAIASQWGVISVLDLRTATAGLESILGLVDWSPTVLLVLVNAQQLSQPGLVAAWPKNCCVAQTLSATSTPAELADFNTAALAVELAAGERPPAWLATIDRPLIAIRRDVADDELRQARAACDRLQAELAPEFDLAGYFVTP